MIHLDAEERRRRLLVRHHLAAPATTVEQVAGDVVGLHGTDPATVVLSLRARLEPFSVADLEGALYDRRSMLRILAMRRTMFVAPLDVAAEMDAACTRALVPTERRKLAVMLAEGGVDDVDGWIERMGSDIVAALRTSGPQPASRLTKLVPGLDRRVRVAVGTRHEADAGVCTRMLFVLSTQGRIARGRPLGTWRSSQYRWAAMDDWLGARPHLEADEARARLAGRWLRAYGPGTVEDLAWWAGWTKAHTRAALSDTGAVAVTTDAGDGAAVPAWVGPDDLDETSPQLPDADGLEPVTLLPALDPTIMGWKERRWYLGGHREALFDRYGNAGPTVWVGGRAVGAWSQRADATVVTRLLDDVGPSTARRVDDAAARLTAWMDGVRITPRFRTRLEIELAADG